MDEKLSRGNNALLPIDTKEEGFTKEIRFSSLNVEYIGYLCDLTTDYSQSELGGYTVTRLVTLDINAKRHISEDHPNDVVWFEENPEFLRRAISSPEIIDREPRLQQTDKINVALAIQLDEIMYLLVVLQYDQNPDLQNPASLYTAYRSPRRYFFSREGLKDKWKVTKK